jgi:signal transduction histidine kinase
MFTNDGFILIVDDNPTNLSVLAHTLKSAGFSIRIAIDGERALEQLQDDCDLPELILLDVQMPGIDGYETCNIIKANLHTQHIPVIFMTALADTESKVKGLSLGAVDYITKPFEDEEILARVRVHLHNCQLTKTLQQWNGQLEQRIAERTYELEKAQLQVVQQEKFATMGQLVAGVAHEINNPISCIFSNIVPAYEYITDLKAIIHLYQQNYPHPVTEIQAALKELDIEFILEDLLKLLASMKLSAERIKDISVSLRNFSRTDTHKIPVNLHDGLDSTLLILRHRLQSCNHRRTIKVVKCYGVIPQVNCYPGLINQVFMNILANAIDALEEFNTEHNHTNCITITTKNIYDQVIISIKDNGMGMTEDVKKRVFDQLFTTKAVGQGTGLGLAIAREIIVEKHGGNIEVNSAPGKGAEFVISLPINNY